MLIKFPQLPTSAMVSAEHTDLYVTMHFEADNIHEARALGKALSDWMTAFLMENGAAEVVEQGSDFSEQPT